MSNVGGGLRDKWDVEEDALVNKRYRLTIISSDHTDVRGLGITIERNSFKEWTIYIKDLPETDTSSLRACKARYTTLEEAKAFVEGMIEAGCDIKN